MQKKHTVKQLTKWGVLGAALLASTTTFAKVIGEIAHQRVTNRVDNAGDGKNKGDCYERRLHRRQS